MQLTAGIESSKHLSQRWEFINQVNSPNKYCVDSLDVLVHHPKGLLCGTVQGIWSATVSEHAREPIKHCFRADAYSSLMINLGPPVSYNGRKLESSIALSPAKKEACILTLPAGAKLAGVRLLPGVAQAMFGGLGNSVTDLLIPNASQSLAQLHSQLRESTGPRCQIRHLYQWLLEHTLQEDKVLIRFQKALGQMQATTPVAEIAESMQLSQRQLERQFQHWIGMTPKRYQRALRVNETVRALSRQPRISLCDLAATHGYSDQSHMTREFKLFTRTSPRRYGQKYSKG